MSGGPDPEPDPIAMIARKLERIEDDLQEHGLTDHRERVTEVRTEIVEDELEAELEALFNHSSEDDE